MHSTAEDRSSIYDPSGHNAIMLKEGWAPIEGTTPAMIDSRNVGSPSAEQPHENLSASLKKRNSRATNVRSQGVGQRKQQPRNIFKESFDQSIFSPKDDRAISRQDQLVR